MELELLKQADFLMGKCGLRRPSPDTSVVPIVKSFLVPMLINPNEAFTFTKEITGDTSWSLCAISSDAGSASLLGVRIQIQLPNGRFLIGGNGQDVGQFAGVGSWRYLVDPEIECEPGSKIKVTLSDVTGLSESLAVNLLFEGCYNYYLRGGQRVASASVASEPRILGVINENILAPCWVAGHGPLTPEGFDDSLFTYSSVQAIINVAGPFGSTLKVPIDAGLDFQLRRILMEVETDNTVTAGVVLGRVRAGAGYAFCDDFMDIERYISGAEYPHDWKVRGQDAIFVDLRLADSAGVGNFYVTLHFEGMRRKRV